MKLMTSISRIIVGLLFMFSGFIKSNDPKGTGIKLSQYFDVFAQEFYQEQDVLTFKLTDNIETDTTWQYTIDETSDQLNVQLNQSETKMMGYDNEEGGIDSFLVFDLFVTINNQIVYQEACFAGDSAEAINISLNVKNKNNVLFNQDLSCTNITKHEIEKNIQLKSFYKTQSVWYDFFRALRPYSIYFAIIMVILEVVLGFAILIGWKPKIMSWLILLMVLFFSFLTWYSAYYNKVTDCGCFGDFLKLEPWTSFWKDIILLFFISFIFFRRNKIIPLFSPLFSWNAFLIVLVSSSVFTIYCNMYLPAWDFLPYKIGNNLNELMKRPANARERDSVVSFFVYERAGKQEKFNLNNIPKSDDWKYVSTENIIIENAWKSEVHGFTFDTRAEINNQNITDSLLNSNNYVILIVSSGLDKSYEASWKKINTLALEAKKQNIPFYAVTSNSIDVADAFMKKNNLSFYFNNGDETLLKTMLRSNPGVMLWKKGVIVDKWSCRSIPKIDKIVKIISKK